MMHDKKRVIFLLSFLSICLAVLIAGWHVLAPKFNYQPPQTIIASALKPTHPLRSFHLQDSNGRIFNEKSLRGHWTLIFFGYTKCPDICPKTLGLVRDTWNLFNSQQLPIPVRFVFADISRHPATSEHLQQFLANYRPEFIGLTGTTAEMQSLSDQLGIYSQQMPDKLDHTAALMLIDTQGRLHAVFTPPFTAEELQQDLITLAK